MVSAGECDLDLAVVGAPSVNRRRVPPEGVARLFSISVFIACWSGTSTVA
jgi:hypothetical protein